MRFYNSIYDTCLYIYFPSLIIKCNNIFWDYFSIVYLCCRLSDKKLVIIKQIPVEQMTKDERQTALNEVKVLSMLNNPFIIKYYENFLEDKALMIVMEYAEGR